MNRSFVPHPSRPALPRLSGTDPFINCTRAIRDVGAAGFRFLLN